MIEYFDRCKELFGLINTNDYPKARNGVIHLLHDLKENKIQYDELVNHLIREVGLYQYIDEISSNWSDRFAKESFKVNTGNEFQTIHFEQSSILKHLLNGDNIALSAPTSFGKSFIIDAFIANKKPNNVVIIVPTISLTDETRKRINKKFGEEYKIITTPNIKLSDKNIFIFPQERAINYSNIIEEIDLLIIDEFYKISKVNDRERAVKLQEALIKLDRKSKQKYFLAPNIKSIKDNPFTDGMIPIVKLDFNTVVLEHHKVYKEIKKDEELKKKFLLKTCRNDKNLIYAALYKEIDKLQQLFLNKFEDIKNKKVIEFSNWLKANYNPDWDLANLILKGVGIHNGRLHRSITQYQVLLFDDENSGLNSLISTSSLIEGVNTSAKNVIIWSIKSGQGNNNLTSLSYKNIKGRAGRMFKHFVGNVYELVEPKLKNMDDIQLSIEIDNSLIGGITNENFLSQISSEKQTIANDQIDKIESILGVGVYRKLREENLLNSNNEDLIYKICIELKENYSEWKRLKLLNSEDSDKWWGILGKLCFLNPNSLRWNNNGNNVQFNQAKKFIQVISKNWETSLPNLMLELKSENISIEDFFTLEKKICHNFSGYLNDFNVLNEIINKDEFIDISNFTGKCSSAFMPSVVLELEEYGLPRMITKKINYCKLIDFENNEMNIEKAISLLKSVGKKQILKKCSKYLDDFDIYIINNFFENI
ncbi:DEAD/DEAH box helicase [Algibacter sp. L4_22]|uniref:DEAD/DEAH box helicase n=1 Tax=Algibacter sp. L4_22 TaxID=2942477 RepID=UPI00201B8F2A|nr:DEAD/DEAH box helicase [Algibacter sp. L4_22]MCL5128110.1 DEAD/DEAH box helicase [Algibacter sp. L4_22]